MGEEEIKEMNVVDAKQHGEDGRGGDGRGVGLEDGVGGRGGGEGSGGGDTGVGGDSEG